MATSWEGALDPALVSRLSRPLTRPGVTDARQGAAIAGRLQRMADRLPLLDSVAARHGGGALSLDAPRIVHARPVSAGASGEGGVAVSSAARASSSPAPPPVVVRGAARPAGAVRIASAAGTVQRSMDPAAPLPVVAPRTPASVPMAGAAGSARRKVAVAPAPSRLQRALAPEAASSPVQPRPSRHASGAAEGGAASVQRAAGAPAVGSATSGPSAGGSSAGGSASGSAEVRSAAVDGVPPVVRASAPSIQRSAIPVAADRRTAEPASPRGGERPPASGDARPGMTASASASAPAPASSSPSPAGSTGTPVVTGRAPADTSAARPSSPPAVTAPMASPRIQRSPAPGGSGEAGGIARPIVAAARGGSGGAATAGSAAGTVQRAVARPVVGAQPRAAMPAATPAVVRAAQTAVASGGVAGGTVQRSADSAPVPAELPTVAAAEGTGQGEVDTHRLADRVYEILVRRLAEERRQRGG